VRYAFSADFSPIPKHICGWNRQLPSAEATGDQSNVRLLADAVEKVENRATPKISQLVIFGLLRRCDAL
jgi:hypothetical protein